MAEAKKKYRLFKVAKELNTGSSTLVDHLQANGFEVNNSPNEKLSADMYDLLLKDFASEKVLKEKAELIKEAKQEKRLAEQEAAREEEEEHLSAEMLKSGYLERDKAEAEKAAAVPVAQETPQTPPETKTVETPVAKTETPVVEEAKPVIVEKPAEVTEAPAAKVETPRVPGLKVKGTIDLDAISGKKPKSKTKKVKEEAEKKPEVKKETAAPVAKEEPAKKEDTPPAKEEKPVEKKDSESKKSPEKAPEKVAAEAEKTEAPSEEAAPAKEDENAVIRASSRTPKLAGLKVMGTIELPSDKKKKSSDGDDTDSEGRKRKRKRKRKKTTAVSPSTNTRKPGDNKRGGDRKKKEDLSEKEINEIIKSTLADLRRGAGRSRQRHRREKRASDARERERKEMEASAEEMFLEVTEFITANELANMMGVAVTEVIGKCMELGLFVSINQRLEADVIQLLTEEYGYEVRFIDIADKDFEAEEAEEVNEEDMEGRSPIITVMGHVDHGKTSLLDHIRSANVIAGEAGGITQHIGAYEVVLPDERTITFLDTPGHEAFTAMRARGAKVTDLVIIVIAADDDVMPQTKEAINHAEAAGVPMIFAINKIDKDGADPDRIRTQLSEMNILLEDWGGKFQSQEISAKHGTGVDELLEKVLLEAELLELKANPKRNAQGTVIEARLDKGRGVVATVLVQEGTLRIQDSMVAGVHFGRVRAMTDERGKRIEEAGPATPVQLLGLSGAPQAGDRFVVYDEEKKAKEIAQKRNELYREQTFRQQIRPTLEEVGRRKALGNFEELNLIVKGDVDGSIEALSDSLLKLSVDEVQVNVIHKAVGQITEADVLLATASDAIIIGFQVRPSLGARKLAENEGIDIRMYSIIYDAINEVRDALEGLLAPEVREQIGGTAEVRETFKISKVGTIAGCMVQTGPINRKDPIRIIRDGIVVKEGKVAALKRFKDDVSEVKKGFECGIQIESYNDLQIGDIIEQYSTLEIARKLKK